MTPHPTPAHVPGGVTGNHRFPGTSAVAAGSRMVLCSFILLTLIVWSAPLASDPDQARYDQVKVALIARCLNHITRPGRSEGTPLHIGLYDVRPAVLHAFEEMAQRVKIGRRSVVVRSVGSLDELTSIDVLYVGATRNPDIATVWQKIEKRGILLVTDRCADKKYLMLNIVLDERTHKISFEVNKANIIVEGFDIHPDLLLLGGSEVDLRQLYRAMQQDLVAREEKVRTQRRYLDSLNARIDSANSLIGRARVSLGDKERELQEQTAQITRQQERMLSLGEDLSRHQILVGERTRQLVQQKAAHDSLARTMQEYRETIARQREETSLRRTELESLNGRIAEKERRLAESEKQVASQSRIMGSQSAQLQAQRVRLLLAGVVVVLLVALAVMILVAYRIKISANRTLEERVQERTRALGEANRQLVEEIDQRRKADAALVRSEQNYRAIYNASNEALFIHDAQSGKLLDVNQTCERLYGYSREEALSVPFENFTANVPPYTMDEVRARLHAAATEGPQVFEWYARNRQGGLFWVEVALSSVTIDGEQRIVAAIRDITERVAARQRQRELEENLHQAEKLKAIGQLAGGIAHDFNNQLAGIMGFADLLNDELSLNSELRSYSENIITLVNRSRDLTAQLLAFARKGNYVVKTIDLHLIIGEVVNLLRHSIDRSITVRSNLEALSPYIAGDPSQIQNAILNCALNARDAMPQGGVLTISTAQRHLDRETILGMHSEIPPGEYLTISVSDTGTGIDEQIRKHLFEPFFTTKPSGKGTGMGLAAVLGTVQAHKGGVTVDSVVGTGSTFTLWLPPVAAPHAGEPAAAPSCPAEAVERSLHVMVVDDEAAIRELATAMFQSKNHQVTVCSDGREAEEIYRTRWQEIDVVILDMIMPGIGGKELFMRLRQINPAIVAILSSGYSLDGEAQEIAALGVKGYIAKPFRRREILDKINSVLRQTDATRQ